MFPAWLAPLFLTLGKLPNYSMNQYYVPPENAKKTDLPRIAFSNLQNFICSLNVIAHGIRMLEPVVLRASRSRCALPASLSG